MGGRGSIWLRIWKVMKFCEGGDGRFGFHQMREISSLAEKRLLIKKNPAQWIQLVQRDDRGSVMNSQKECKRVKILLQRQRIDVLYFINIYATDCSHGM